MQLTAAITVLAPEDEVRRCWERADLPAIDGATVTYAAAPGDRGTEVHVALAQRGPGGKVGEVVGKVTGAPSLAQVKDRLRHVKQLVETGVISRSDGVPEGERFERKLKQHPAQPLSADELDKAGVA
ncbi:hypothetical protein [Conexibacter sp. SYSU D00693]|uniref:hypothetical protein n=1 Tax=Conexibacter sp. SYSU D00693 TaxID=2812560 RepID=UPI00196A21D2|nr:hypothetical protein [Conexibacter sp. SYSU D00693]